MMNRKMKIIGVVLVLVVLAGGVAVAQGPGYGGMMGGGGFRGPGMGGTYAEFDSEAEYLSMMIPHHEEAVESAREVLAITEDEELTQLLENIVTTQSEEIELMEGWLADRYPDVEPSLDYQPMMRSYEGLSAEEAEEAFLEDMIPHHMHAVMTSRMLLSSSNVEHEDTAELASGIISSQLTEIDQMRNLYAQNWDRSYGGDGYADSESYGRSDDDSRSFGRGGFGRHGRGRRGHGMMRNF